jgi:hypothetical protein
MRGKMSCIFAGAILSVAFTSLVIVATDATQAQPPPTQPHTTAATSAIVTGTDMMI